MLKPYPKRCLTNVCRLIWHTFIITCLAIPAVAQQSPKQVINSIITAANTRNANLAIEKIYLQTDKPSYQSGDTLRFKAYLLQGTSLKPSRKSGVMYVEIANDSSKLITRIMVPCNDVISGNIALDDKYMPQGTYILRAYTNWMRNFNETYVFRKLFYYSKVTNNDWLINYQTNTAKGPEATKVQLNLKINNFDNAPVGLRELQLKLTDGKRTWFKSNVSTTLDGLINTDFELPDKADSKNLALTVRDMRKGEGNRSLVMPLSLNRPQNIDLQFMPEGGNLVAGLPAYVAFKAINEDGLGVNLTGSIYNNKQQEVAAFSSAHKGIGSFYMLPQAGETYTAKIKLPDGTFKSFPLPAVKTSGFMIKVNNVFKSDSLTVTVTATPDVAATANSYYLMGHTRGMVFYGALLKFDNNVATLLINKKNFPAGIAHLTLAGADKKAISERLVFTDRNNKLNITLASSKPVYKQRDSVALNLKVTDTYGNPVEGIFSLAVTDDGQVKNDSLKQTSIVSYMLLTSDLKGSIEDPGYYENSSDDITKWRNLDRLLLAQGWSVYNWDDAFMPAKTVLFAAEPEFLIRGRVTNVFNKPVPGSRITLLSKKQLLIADTVTNANGVFTFRDIVSADTAIYFLQARNKKGKSSNVGIEVDEFIPPVFKPITDKITPWFVNTDSTSLLIIKRQTTLKQNMETLTSGKMLKEVVIRNKRIVKDSKNLNGPGEADVVVDEEQLQKAGRTSLKDLLYKHVKGFNYHADKGGTLHYWINNMLLHLIIDGMDIEFFKPEDIRPIDYFNQYLEYYDAEEILGIEVMTSMRNSSSYTNRYIDPMANSLDHTFIEITTRSGHGPFVKKAVGTYVYRPMPFTMPKQFYAPKYNADSVPNMTDIRSTIHWEPNIITDKEGKATVSFFTADAPGKYSVIAEGTDLDGSIGVKRATISVKKR